MRYDNLAYKYDYTEYDYKRERVSEVKKKKKKQIVSPEKKEAARQKGRTESKTRSTYEKDMLRCTFMCIGIVYDNKICRA